MEQKHSKKLLVYSNIDISLYTDVIYKSDDYYIITYDQFKELCDHNYKVKIISEIENTDVCQLINFFSHKKINGSYKDNFTIYKFEKLILKKETKKFYIFEYKNFTIYVNKKYFDAEESF